MTGNAASKYLIINSDDYGLCPSVNKGIIECLQLNSISDFSFIINPDFSDESIRLIKQNNYLNCGIHLNLLGLKSLAGTNSSIVYQGNYPELTDLVKLIITNKINSKDIEYELMCQFQFLLDNEIEITHIDTHRNIHIIPKIYSIVKKVSEKLGLNVPIRIPKEKNLNLLKTKFSNILRIEILNYGSSYLIHRYKLKPSVYAIGGDFFNNITPNMVFDHITSKILKSKYHSFELAVHPGYNSIELGKIDKYTIQRETELMALQKLRIPSGIELVSFKKLFK